MIHASVMFGTRCGRQTDELEEAAEGYLSSMYKPGQLCGEHFIFWFKGRLSAHVLLAGRNAMERRYHSDWGKRELNKVIESFGREPVWRIMDDKAERLAQVLKCHQGLRGSRIGGRPNCRRGSLCWQQMLCFRTARKKCHLFFYSDVLNREVGKVNSLRAKRRRADILV